MRRKTLVATAEAFAERLPALPDTGTIEAPRAELRQLETLGLMTAPLLESLGGLGLGGYLRQPNPDGTLADVGRSALLRASLDIDACAFHWHEEETYD